MNINPTSPDLPSEPGGAAAAPTGLVRWLGLVLFVGTLVCFWPTGRLGFVLYEDPLTVSQHPVIREGLSWGNFVWCFKSIVTCNWQPLTSLSHMLDCQLFGLDAGKHHLVSVLLHALNVLLLFVLLRRLTGAVWRSAFVAALFGWHPMHVESVVWLSERKDVLSAFFFLLTVCAYAGYVRRVGRGQSQVSSLKSQVSGPEQQSAAGSGLSTIHYPPSTPSRPLLWYLLALLCYALGLMSKPNIVTLPFVLLLLDYWPLGRLKLRSKHAECRSQKAEGEGQTRATPNPSDFRLETLDFRLFLEKLPFFALTVADCAITFIVQKVYGSLPTLEMFPLWKRVANALTSYAVYLGKCFWPGDMGVFYLFPHSIPLWQPVGAALLLAVISAVVIWRLRKQPYLAVGWFWFLGILVPMIGLVQTGVQSRADHHTYLAYVGLGLMVAWGVPAMLAGLARPQSTVPESSAQEPPAAPMPQGLGTSTAVLGVVGVVVLGACWYGARGQLGYWKDSVTLFAHTVDISSNNEAAHNMLGSALLQAGRREEAAAQFRETLKLAPYYKGFRTRAYDNLGTLCLQEHKLDEAIALFSEALKLKPNSPSTHFNLGAAYGQKGEMDKAVAEFKCVADMPPGNDEELNDADLQGRVARALIRCGQPEAGLKHAHDLVAAHPENPAFHGVLGGVCVLLNRPEEAIPHLRQAVRGAPKVPLYLNQLAALLASAADAKLRNGAEAVELAERACELTQRQNAGFLDTLGMAYAEANRFPEAIIAAQEAKAVALAAQDPRGAEMEARKLELYRASQPYHEPAKGN